MSLRARITVLTAGAVSMSIALVAAVVFFAEREELRAEVDGDLRERASVVAEELLAYGEDSALEDDPLGELPAHAQIIRPGGQVLPLVNGAQALPVDARGHAVAAGEHDRFYSDTEAEGQSLRVLTVPLRSGALQVAQPLGELNQRLVYLAGLLAAITFGGLSIAALLGRLVARSALKPVSRLSAGAESVTATRDLSTRLEVRGGDELSRLAATLNTMLEALHLSQRSQRQLVTDASHELRTPLSSLRTNMEVLARATELSPEDRDRLVADLRAELEGLIATVDDLLDLAGEEEHDVAFEEVSIDKLVQESVAWTAHRFPHVRFKTTLEPHLARANRALAQRAIGNLLDNAGKWSQPGDEVEVRLARGRLEVRDHGQGIHPEDLPRVFERFYRAPAARGLPGSGLGLAIVRQVADTHRWRVSAENVAGGGSCFCLDLFTDSSPSLAPHSPSSHPARVQLDDPEQHTGERGRWRVPRPGRLGLVLMATVPLVAAVGASVLATDAEPASLHTVAGQLVRCGSQFCVDDVIVDFGPAWYVDSAQARHDYDGDGRRRMLSDELSGLTGRRVTLETDGGPLDQDVFTLDGLPVRNTEGELPPPDRETSAGAATFRAGFDSDLAGVLTRCGNDYCLDGIRLDFGPAWYLMSTSASVDFDEDGRRCSLAAELGGLVGTEVEASVHRHEDADVYGLQGHRYRDAVAEPPWANGPLEPDPDETPSC